MIRINLLKTQIHHRPHKSATGRPLTIPRPVLIVGTIACLMAAFGGIGFYIWTHPNKPLVVAHTETVPVMPQLETTPSTFASPRVVEDVVHEVQTGKPDLSESGFVTTPYEQMSFPEQVNYELLFAKLTCTLLNRSVSSGIRLRSLSIENFQTVYLAGRATSREELNAMGQQLKQGDQKVEILPPPLSYIKKSTEDDGYAFAFVCKTAYGLNLKDPAVDLALGQVPRRAAVADVVDQIKQVATEYSVKLDGPITETSAEKVGEYRRSIYTLKGLSTYNNFVSFLAGLYNKRVPCAFKKFEVTAQSGANVTITAEILFTLKE